MAISRPFLLAVLGAVLLGVTVLAVQNSRTASDADSTPAVLQAKPAPAPAETPAESAPADTLKSALNLSELESARFTANVSLGSRSQALRFNLSGAFERGAVNDIPDFDVNARISFGKQHVSGGFVALGEKAYFTQGDTGWRLPAEIWSPVVDAVGNGSAAQPGPGLQLHPDTWIRDVKSEGTDQVGGVETDHVSAQVDPNAVANDLLQAAKANGADVPNSRRLARTVRSAELDVWVGTDDHILRRLSGAVAFRGPGRLALDVRLTGVNKPQQIEAPAHIRAGAPSGAFGSFAERLVGGLSGGSVSLKALTSPNPGRAARAVRNHRKVVILFHSPRALDDRAMVSVIRNVNRRTKVLVLTDQVDAVERYGKLVEDLGVSQTPSVVIIGRSGKAQLIEGFVDSDTLTQAVADAR
jgi:hypothetical protein